MFPYIILLYTTEYRSDESERTHRLVTLLNNQSQEIYDQVKIIKGIEEFYTELNDSKKSTIMHTNLKEVTEI